MQLLICMRSTSGREGKAPKRNGADHRQAAQEEGRYENRVTYREGDDGARRLGGLVDQDELVAGAGEAMQMRDLDSSEVEVRVREGEVVLVGTVPDRSMKYRIEQIADRCTGVVESTNRIRVRKQQ